MYVEEKLEKKNKEEKQEGGVKKLEKTLRPILIISLIWMCFELTFSPHLTD